MLPCFFSKVQEHIAKNFQMSHYSSSQVKGLQNCDLPKLDVKKIALLASRLFILL